MNKIGIAVSALNDEQKAVLELPKGGVIVDEVGKGAAKDAGLQRGDVILRIQNTVISSLADFEQALKSLPVGKSVAVLVQRRGGTSYIALKLDK
jgi:serine protease Do